jgi:YggT family protein
MQPRPCGCASASLHLAQESFNRYARGVMFGPILWFVDQLLGLYAFVIIIFVAMSWLEQLNIVSRSNQLVYAIMDFSYRVTEPLLRPIRSILPNLGGLDLSPLILLLLVAVVRMYLGQLATVLP